MAVDDNGMQQSPSKGLSTTRMVVPDVARGVALLGIAVANLPTAWLTPGAAHSEFLGSINSVFDQILAVLTTLFAHTRGLPLFTTLLGFGVGLIAMSLWRKRFPPQRARQIIVRRYFFLAVFGAVHLLLIFYGDIMFYYGLSGMIIGLLLTMRDKVLSIISYVIIGLTFVGSLAFLLWGLISGIDMSAFTSAGIAGTDYSTLGGLLQYNAITFGLGLTGYPFYLIAYGPIMLIGFTWARRGVLADAASHRKELIAWTVFGWIIILGIGLPWGLAAISVLPNELEALFLATNSFVGTLTGPALLAMFALLLQPFQARVNNGEALPVWLQVPMALGKRSMSGYVFQSIAFFIICYPVVLGYTPDSVTAQTALAFGVWVASLLLAWMLEKTNKRGPFEAIHRRLSYGPTLQPELYSAKQRKRLEQQPQQGQD
ncbi:MAG: DUF418 domain-containing protein [Corynebacterium casei]|uniref:DUF418 domain-containing protein n=2 Tax=Corynebacterium casei TaxID=160386 RepID=UPI0004B47241|nr:DUF418 domain-containing protein [Corynebacterium casei]MDN6312507.1 DUF418 domain-containing protein [Corynebacterium casei]